MANTKAVAISSNFMSYPGLGSSHTIAETFQINKISVVPFFSKFANYLSRPHLKSMSWVNRQFRSMTFIYMKEQISKTKKIIQLFIDHFVHLKKKGSEDYLYPDTLAELQKMVADFQQKVTNKCEVHLPENNAEAYRRYFLSVDNLSRVTLNELIKTIKLVPREGLPNHVIEYLDGKVTYDDQFPNRYPMMRLDYALNLEIQPNIPFSPNLIKVVIKCIKTFRFNGIKDVYEKMMNEKKMPLIFFPFLAYAFKNSNNLEHLNRLLLSVDNLNRENQSGILRSYVNDLGTKLLCSNAVIIAEIERCTNHEQLYKIFQSKITLLDVAEDLHEFCGAAEIAEAFVKTALILGHPLYAHHVLDFYCIELKGINCEKALKVLGNYYLNLQNIDNLKNLFFTYSSFVRDDDDELIGLTQGRQIIYTCLKSNELGLNSALEFINHPHIIPRKRIFLQDVLIDYFIGRGMYNELLLLVGSINQRNKEIDKKINEFFALHEC